MKLKNEKEEYESIKYDTELVQELRVNLEDNMKLITELVHFLDTGKELFAKYGVFTADKDEVVSLSFSSAILREIDKLEPEKYDLDKLLDQAFIEDVVSTLTFDLTNTPEAIKNAMTLTFFKYLDHYSNDNKDL